VRIVSLVPSLTLTLAELGVPVQSMVGRTPWCIHPASYVTNIPVVGGTKTPTLSKMLAAQPDLVVMDRDENPKEVHDWCLLQGMDVFVTDIRRPHDVPSMLRALGERVGCTETGWRLASQLEEALTRLPENNDQVGLPLIWHDPLMAANGTTYAGQMIAAMGFTVPTIEPDGNGYPKVDVRAMADAGVTDLFLSSEPHDFSNTDAQRLVADFEANGVMPPRMWFVDGEALTWMGSATERSLASLATSMVPYAP